MAEQILASSGSESGTKHSLLSLTNQASELFDDRQLVELVSAHISLTGPASCIFDAVAGYLLGQLHPVQECLDQLVGRARDIANNIDQLESCSADLSSISEQLSDICAQDGGWFGKSADQYAKTISLTAQLSNTYSQTVLGLAKTQRQLIVTIGITKQVISQAAFGLIRELIATSWAAAATFPVGLASYLTWAGIRIFSLVKLVYHLMNKLLTSSTSLLGVATNIGQKLHRSANTLKTSRYDSPDWLPAAKSSAGDRFKGGANDADIDFAKLLNHFSTTQEYDDLAIADSGSVGLPAGYRRLTNGQIAQLLGVSEQEATRLMRNEKSGFQAGCYQNDAGEYFVTFAGTDFSQNNDVYEDIFGGLSVSPQTDDVLNLVSAIENSDIGGDNFVYLGHSLGGRLAAVASLASGNAAITFNAAGVSPATLSYLASSQGLTAQQLISLSSGGQIRSYATSDDLLTNLQERIPVASQLMPDAVGQRIQLGGKHYLNQVDGHLLDNVIAEMNRGAKS